MALENSVALVTGASRGIGKSIALRLAREGADVAVNYNREEAYEVVEEIESIGRSALAVAADVSQEEKVKGMVHEVIARLGRIDIVVNNAGITQDSLLVRMSEQAWDRVLAINLKGTFNCIKTVARSMMKQRHGRIVNISSINGITGNAGQANYAASKAGVIGLTKTAARELASRGITVNAIAPGFIRTSMTDKLPEEVASDYVGRIPLGRPGTAEDVAAVVAFLASEDASYITGQVIHVDGGLVM